MQMKIALVGNSGSGKTTLFNSLTGVPQDAGNRAGITVERKEAPVADDPEVILMDLPGIVSLAPYTREEAAVRNCLVQERPDAILNVIEGTNPEPGLFLSTQLNDLGVPFVMAVGKMDLVRKKGRQMDLRKLETRMHCRVVELSARDRGECAAAVRAAVEAAGQEERLQAPAVFGENVERALLGIGEILKGKVPGNMLRWYAIKVFERDGRALDAMGLSPRELEEAEALIRAVEAEEEDDSESVLTNQRYAFISSVMEEL